MIILRQKTYATAASFKPKFRKRFRSGDFSYAPAKDPKNEALNHQAYKEVACEDEFKNNPETYKIRQGLFSEKISENDRRKLKRSRNINLVGAAASSASFLANLGVDISRLRRKQEITSPLITAATTVPVIATSAYNKSKIKKMYKKYHPEVENPEWKEINRWAREVGVPQNIPDMKKQKKERKEGKK